MEELQTKLGQVQPPVADVPKICQLRHHVKLRTTLLMHLLSFPELTLLDATLK